MLTLKIISHGESELVNVFVANRISHIEHKLNDGKAPNQTFNQMLDRNKPQYVVGSEFIINPDSELNNMIYSWVFLHDKDDSITPIVVAPVSDCYIMSEGKTVDHFNTYFLEDNE